MAGSPNDWLGRFDPTLPLDRARTIPAAWYTDPNIYRAECRTIFAGVWQAAGRAEPVAAPGTFFATELPGRPVVVVRDEAGTLRAFANVCRHRAARVVSAPEGKATRLRCRYHGWTYDLAGRLRGAPEFDGVADFRREDQSLPELAVDTWGPFVWVHPGRPSAPLADWLAPLPRLAAGLGIEALRFVERREYVLACNWKVFVDNYLDGGYHVNTVHPALAGILDYTHYRTDVFANASVQTSPLRASDATDDGLATGKVRTGASAFYAWVFPNFMVNAYQGVMDTNLVLPLGPDRCRVVFDFYFAAAEGAAAKEFIAESIAVADRVQREDMAICEEVQHGLAGGTFDVGRYSVRREAAVYHFHRLLAEGLRAAVNAD
jgi:choline monooxygenase